MIGRNIGLNVRIVIVIVDRTDASPAAERIVGDATMVSRLQSGASTRVPTQLSPTLPPDLVQG